MTKIVSLEEIKSQNLNYAFIKGNRNVVSKNQEAKKASIEKYGILVPLLYVTGSKAVADDCELVDLKGKDIPSADAEKYIVIIDGQHRLSAAIDCKVEDKDIPLFKASDNFSTKELLAEANIETEKWRSADFINGTVLFNPDNELANFAQSLSKEGYSISSISKILCFNNKLTSEVFAKLMKGESPKIDVDLERAQCFISATTKFSGNFKTKRYLIDAVIKLSSKKGYEPVCSAISKISIAEIDEISRLKGEEAKNEAIEAVIKKYLEN